MTKPPPYNAASRLAAILNRALQSPPGRPALEVWANVFGLPAQLDSDLKLVEVARLLGEMREELELVRASLASTTLPELAYADKLQNLSAAMSPLQILANWGDLLPALTARESLRYLTETVAYVLPNEEDPTPVDVVGKLRNMIDALDRAISAATDVPSDVRRFLLSLVDAMRRALRDHEIAGGKAVRQTVEWLTWEWNRMAVTKKGFLASPVVRRAGAVLAAVLVAIPQADSAIEHAAKLPRHVAELRAAIPEAREALGLPPAAESPKRVAKPKEMKQLPERASPGNDLRPTEPKAP